jgi:hypothetical protein
VGKLLNTMVDYLSSPDAERLYEIMEDTFVTARDKLLGMNTGQEAPSSAE